MAWNIKVYRDHWKLGTRERLAIEIGLNGGPRRGDAVRLGPTNEQDDRDEKGNPIVNLVYEMSKTGAEVCHELLPPLRAAIETMPVLGLET